jgi:hypothetical protein
MNIFFLDSNPKVAASYYCNRRCIKIILEIAQMLCTSYNLQNHNTPYKSAHINHPMSKWVRHSKENFIWTCEHGLALCHEYTRRYGKIHSCQKIITDCYVNMDKLVFSRNEFSDPPRCFGEFASIIDVV